MGHATRSTNTENCIYLKVIRLKFLSHRYHATQKLKLLFVQKTEGFSEKLGSKNTNVYNNLCVAVSAHVISMEQDIEMKSLCEME